MKTRDIILTSVVLSWGVTVATLVAVLELPIPWSHTYLSSEIITLGGGPGEGTITLAAGKALDDGMAMMTMSGASRGGAAEGA